MSISRFPKHLSIFITVLLISLLFIGSIFAAGILVSPGGFQIKFSGTNTYNGQVIVENTGNQSLNVIVSKARLLMDNTNLEFSNTGIAQWITVNPTNFTLASHQNEQVSFTINAPKNINYSDALGAIVISGYTPKQANTGNGLTLQVQQVPQVVVPLVVGLPGKIVNSLVLVNKTVTTALLGLMQGKFVYEVQNDGTVYANMTVRGGS